MSAAVRDTSFEWHGRPYPVMVQVRVSQLLPGADLAAMLNGSEPGHGDDVSSSATR